MSKLQSFPACDGVMLRHGQVQCVFTEESYERLSKAVANHPRCIKHGNLITDYIQAFSIEEARKKAREYAER
jgi:hypothetical protein